MPLGKVKTSRIMRNVFSIFLVVLFLFSLNAYSQTSNELNEKAKTFIQQRDFTNAVPVLKQAANLGSAESQYNLAICLFEGLGITKDEKQANEWLLKSAKQNYANAQFKLAYSYAGGRGVEKDLSEAFSWFLKAAENGDEEAQFIVAGMYKNGQGIEKNLDKFLYWAKVLAKQKNSQNLGKSGRISSARYNLALIYLKGEGTILPDATESYKWFLILNESKRDFSVMVQKQIIKQVTELQSKLSKDDQDDAKKKAEEFLGNPLSNFANLLKENF